MKRFDQINVIPFIDIMLVLLAIVLTTATFIAQGKIPIQLPTAKHASAPDATERTHITIAENGALHLNDQSMHLTDMDQALSKLPPDTAINLRVDGRTAFNYFVAIIDVLKKHQLKNVSINTRNADQASAH